MAPNGWSAREVGSLTTFLGRGTAPKYIDDPTGVYAINQKCVRNGKIDVAHARPHVADSPVRAEAVLQDGDVCVNSTGTGTIGRVGLWVNPTGETYFADTHVTIVRPDTDQVEPKFLAEALQLLDTQRRMESECFTGSTNQVELSRTAFGALQILVPPMSDQKKIAAILGSVDDTIQATQAVIDQTRKVKAGLLQQLLTRGVGHTRFKQTEIGEIPESWGAVCLGTVCRFQPGFAFKSKDFVRTGDRLVRGSNVGVGTLNWEDDITEYWPRERRSQHLEYVLQAGDIVVAMDRPFISAGFKIARVTEQDLPALLLQRVGRFMDFSGLNPRYLWHLLQSGFVLGHLMSLQKGTDLPHISRSDMEACLVPIPEIQEQTQIADYLDSVDRTIAAHEQLVQSFEQVKMGLMADLLSGRVCVEVTA